MPEPLPPHIPPVQFLLSDNARRGIEIMRHIYLAHYPQDPPVALYLQVILHYKPGDPRYGSVVVQVITRSRYDEVAPYIQRALDYEWLLEDPDYPFTVGKVLDFDYQRGHFLRDPADASETLPPMSLWQPPPEVLRRRHPVGDPVNDNEEMTA